MMRTKTNNRMLSLLYVPACMALLLLGLFGLVWLRSNVLTINYDIRSVEEKRMEALKDMKMLLADRAGLMSLARINGPLRESGQADARLAGSGFVTPDRVRVIHVRSSKGPEPRKASFEVSGRR